MLPALLTTTERTRLMRALVAVLVLDPLRLPAPRALISPAVETSLEVRPLRLPTLRAGSIAHRSNHSITATNPAEIPCAAQATRLQSTTTPTSSDTDASNPPIDRNQVTTTASTCPAHTDDTERARRRGSGFQGSLGAEPAPRPRGDGGARSPGCSGRLPRRPDAAAASARRSWGRSGPRRQHGNASRGRVG